MAESEDLYSRAPCVMVSSTFYDLQYLRDALRHFIEELGYRPLLSEHPSFPIDPDATTAENCRRRVEQDADVLVLLIGRRYGTIDKHSASSVTNVEYLAARRKGIPIYAFVEAGMVPLLAAWKANPALDVSADVDSPKVFEFLDRVRSIDSVWMQEFRTAGDIVGALRTQFAFQQNRGLQLQARVRAEGDLDWSLGLRGHALRLALDKPRAWEHRLFAAALTERVRSQRMAGRRHHLNLAFGSGEDVERSRDWILARISDARRMIGTIEDVVNGVLQEGLGKAGQPGDAETISFAADAVGDLYRDALEWSARVRRANVEERFRTLQRIVGHMLDDAIEKIEGYGPRITTQIDEAFLVIDAGPRTGPPLVLNLELKIEMPSGIEQALADEIERLGPDLDE